MIPNYYDSIMIDGYKKALCEHIDENSENFTRNQGGIYMMDDSGSLHTLKVGDKLDFSLRKMKIEELQITERELIQATEFIHFGSSRLDRNKFKDISEETYCGGLKPRGGLWGSNESLESYGWREWCRDNEYECDTSSYFRFRLKDSARLLVVTGDELLEQNHLYEMEYPPSSTYKDWTSIRERYDAVYMAAGSDRDLYFKYYGWDCDSILVLNFDSIEQV